MIFTPSDFDIKPGYFRHESRLHGAMHTYRVMCHVLALGNKMNVVHETRVAFCAAFVHDMARRHDGISFKHGPRAAKEKVPEFIPLFRKYGLEPADVDAIKIAVTYHSQYDELRTHDMHYLVTSLLKDADALDRIRMGENNLNPKFIRHKATFDLIDFSHKLYYQSEKLPNHGFESMLSIAQELYGTELVF